LKKTLRGVGIDVVSVERVRRLIDQHPKLAIERLYCSTDLIDVPTPGTGTSGLDRSLQRYYQNLALKFAAKEATIKTLSIPMNVSYGLNQIAVRGLHRFTVHLSPGLEAVAEGRMMSRLYGSASLSGDCAIAVVYGE
jgi:phosphopantetheinyl transferase (holo-ACP synthase)